MTAAFDVRAKDSRLIARARWVARGAALFVIAVGVVVELGWALGVGWLRAVVPSTVAMNPVTAAGFVLAGMSLWLLAGIEAGPGWRERQGAQVLAGLVVLLGAQRLLAYAVEWPWALDELVFRSRLAGNHMAPNTAGSFVLTGVALLTLDVEVGRRRARPSVWFALLPGAAGLAAIAGYLYGVKTFYGVGHHIAMAVNTAACFIALSIGLLYARPLKEPMKTLTSRTAGGTVGRRILPIAVVVPLVLGYLRLRGQHLGWYDTEFGAALFAVSIVVVLVAFIYLAARSLMRAEVRSRDAERALATSEAFYHTLVETLPQRIFRKDLQGRFTFANTNFCAEVGRTCEQLLGKTDYDFFPRELAERYRRDDQQVIRTGTPLEKVEEHVTPTGEKLYVQVIKSAVYDEHGRVVGSQGIFWDVTEKKRYELLLEQKNQELEHAAESQRAAHEGLLNAHAALQETYTALQESLEQRNRAYAELDTAHADLKRTQTQLVQSEKLAGLGQMVAGVAHEINNPLSFVANNVAVVQRDVAAVRKLLELYREADGAMPPDLAERIRAFEQEVDLAYTMSNLDGLFTRSREGLRRIQQIVKDLRDFARLDEAEYHDADLNAGVESTVNIIQGYAKRHGVKIVTEPGALPMVSCRPAKLNQVVMNLISNAIDASPQGQTVTVRTAAGGSGVGQGGGGGTVRIEVEDHGTGIPAHIRDRIFDPFFTTKPPGQGTGLGLSISYGIVQDHGGRIEVRSEPGQGTTFTVILPVHPPGKRPT